MKSTFKINADAANNFIQILLDFGRVKMGVFSRREDDMKTLLWNIYSDVIWLYQLGTSDYPDLYNFSD